ncbi:MAG: hypothetical protein NZ483_10855 [Verrucomicrobiae bacterium]|nr:hypothetical protein [Verrucomicrobiae bacterium]
MITNTVPYKPAVPDHVAVLLQQGTISLSLNPHNPNHHLYRNNGTWWIHFTIHLPDYTKHRVRFSLQTRDVEVARARRDAILAASYKHQICFAEPPVRADATLYWPQWSDQEPVAETPAQLRAAPTKRVRVRGARRQRWA